MHRKIAAAIFAALMLAVAGCGGDDTEPLTRAQLVSRVEQTCRQASARMEENARAGRTGDVAAILSAAADAQADVSARIDAFEPPEELSDDWDTFKEGLSARADAIRRAAEAARADGQRAYSDLSGAIEGIQRRVVASAEALGVSTCL